MGLISDFNKALTNWCLEQGFGEINFEPCEEFCCYHKSNTIAWEVITDDEMDNQFRQFLYEYGLNYDIYEPFCMSLLHEIGHLMTIPYFSTDEFEEYEASLKAHPPSREIENSYWYWELPLEFSANMWAINWANNYMEEFQRLHHLCKYYINKIFDCQYIVDQIQQWMEDVQNGEWTGHIWIEEEDEDEC